jgi:hypothetical protein
MTDKVQQHRALQSAPNDGVNAINNEASRDSLKNLNLIFEKPYTIQGYGKESPACPDRL